MVTSSNGRRVGGGFCGGGINFVVFVTLMCPTVVEGSYLEYRGGLGGYQEGCRREG